MEDISHEIVRGYNAVCGIVVSMIAERALWHGKTDKKLDDDDDYL